MRLVLTVLLPASFGFCAAPCSTRAARSSLAVQVIGIVGGFGAGLKHEHWRGGVLRGLCGGAIFGAFILVGHTVVGSSDHGPLPEVQCFQILITVFFGVPLGWLGARLRVGTARRRGGP